jgi:hypothetical protein
MFRKVATNPTLNKKATRNGNKIDDRKRRTNAQYLAK